MKYFIQIPFVQLNSTIRILSICIVLLCSYNSNAQCDPSITVNVVTQNLRCNGDNSGSIAVTVAGGFPTASNNYNYSLFSGIISPIIINSPFDNYTFTNLPANTPSSPTYFLVVQVPLSGGGFTFCYHSLTLTEPPALAISSASIKNVSCAGGNDGAIDATATGGPTAPYTYSWSNGATTEDISGLIAGDYTLTITDANNCTLSETFTITEPAPIVPNETISNVTCNGTNDGSILLAPTGGASPYLYSWNNGSTSKDLTNVGPGTYTVTITDNNSCSKVASFSLTSPAPVTGIASASPASVCSGNSTVITAALNAPFTPAANAYSFNGGVTFQASSTFPIAHITADTTINVVVKDINGCTSTIIPVTVTTNAKIVASAVQTKFIACSGASTAELTVNVTGSSTGFTYSLNGGPAQSSPVFSNLPAGSYTITVNDTNGCSLTLNATITAPLALVVSAAPPTQPTCATPTGGAIDVTVSNGTPAYTYLWSNGAITQDLTNVGPGTYKLIVNDSQNCKDSITVVLNPIPVITGTATANPANVCSGKPTVITAALNAPFIPAANAYSFNGGVTFQVSSTFPIAHITADTTINVVVKDINGCISAIIPVTVTTPAKIVASIVQTKFIACSGASTAELTVNVTGSSTGFTYSLNGGPAQSSPVFSNLPAGSYTITVNDTNGCSLTLNATITAPLALVVSAAPPTQPTCATPTGGAIDVTVSNGTPAYTYLWSNGAITQDLTNVGPGTYKVIVNDSQNCKDSITVVLNPIPVITGTATANPANVCSGKPTVITAALNAPFIPAANAYSFNGGVTFQASPTFPIAHITADTTINVVVKDINGCISAIMPVTVTTTAISASIAQTKFIACNGASTAELTVSVTGNSTGFTYSLNGGPAQSSPVFSNLPAGNYTITINGNGCISNHTATVTQPTTLTLALKTVVHVNPCAGNSSNGSIAVTANGGRKPYTFKITPSGLTQTDSIFSNLTAGNYTIEITDANGCKQSVSTTINAPTPLIVSATTPSQPTCANQTGGSIDVSVSNGTPAYSYLWSTGATTQDLTNLGPGTYKIIVTDSKNCKDSVTAIINPAPTITGTATASPAIVCSGQSTTITAVIGATYTPAANAYSFNGGLTFQASPTFPIAHITGDTTINVLIKDINGCLSNPIPVTVTTSKISASVTQTKFIACNGSSNAELSVTGGLPSYTYSLNGGVPQSSPVFSNLPAGNYTIVINDGTACNPSYNSTITEPSAVTAGIKTVTDVNPCTGSSSNGSIAVTANGGTKPYTFKITPSGPTQTDSIFSNLTAGNYTIEITDANGCKQSVSTTINAPTPLIVSATTPSQPTCANQTGGAIDVSVSNGTPAYSYLWSTGATTQDLTNLSPGTYKVIVTDSKNCKDSVTAIINPAPTITGTATASPASVCSGQGTMITAVIGATYTPAANAYSFNEGLTFQTSPTFPIAHITGDTTINVLIKDINGCLSNPIPVTVTTNKIAGLNLNQTKSILCNGTNTAELTVTGGSPSYTYSLNGGVPQSSPVFSNLPAGSYTVVINNGGSCDASLNATIIQPTPLTLALKTVTDVNPCTGSSSNGSIAVTANGGTKPYTFKITPSGPTQTDSTFTNLTAGNYTIEITDANGCKQSVSTTINAPTPLVVVATTPSQSSCANHTGGAIDITVSNGTPAYSYLWSTGATTQDLTNLGPGTYKVVVTDSKNCKDSVTAIINPAPTITGTATASPATLCTGQSTTITAAIDPAFTPATNAYSFDGGVTFQVSATFFIPTIIVDTTVTVVLKDVNGCLSNPIPVSITTTKIVATITISKVISCNGASDGEITVTVATPPAGILYSIDGVTFQASNVFSNLPKGTYTILIDDGSTCKSSYSITLTEPSVITLGIKSTVNINPCAGDNNGSITVTTNGGNGGNMFTITPSGLTQTDSLFKSLTAGSYTITVKDSKGCSATASTTLIQPNGIDTAAIVPIIVNNICPGDITGSIQLTNVTGGISPYTYTLNGITNTTSKFGSLLSGNYSMIITDNNNCKANYLFAITEPESIVYTAIPTASSCNKPDGSIEITNVTGGNPPYKYSINDGNTYSNNPIFTNLGAATYHLRVSDNQCSTTKDITLQTKPAPVPYIRLHQPTCNTGENGFAVVDSVSGGVPLFQYNFNGIDVGSTTVYSNLKAGSYKLQITDQACTYDIDSFYVYNENTLVYDTLSAPQITITEPKPITGQVLSVDADRRENSGLALIYNIKGGTPGYTWSADNINYKPVVNDSIFLNYLSKGNHTIYVQDTNACVGTFDITIHVQFFIPNLISPNKDGKNDRFEIMALPVGSELKIANRWGNQVYYSDNYDNSWDADQDSDGIYYYELKLPNGDRHKGWLEVIR